MPVAAQRGTSLVEHVAVLNLLMTWLPLCTLTVQHCAIRLPCLCPSFVAMSGAAALPEILGLPTRVAMVRLAGKLQLLVSPIDSKDLECSGCTTLSMPCRAMCMQVIKRLHSSSRSGSPPCPQPKPQAHTIPMHATGEFGMPLAGTGFSAPTAWLNRTQVGGVAV